MNKLSTIAGFVAVSLLCSLQLNAQELGAEHQKAAKAALAASKTTDQFDQILPTISANLKSEIISARPDLADLITLVVDEETLKLAARRGDLENESATIYGRVFSEEELKQIAEFYSSTTGQKLLREAPIITRELNKASQIWATGIIRDLKEAVAAGMKEKGAE